MKITRQTTPTPQKRRRALRAGGMASRLRGNDGYLSVDCYLFNSCLGNKNAGYKHILRGKNQFWRTVGKRTRPASFKGYVYDDKSRPLANVKISIGRTASVSTTDANGLFQLDNIPPGRIDLFVDGRTVNPITAGNLQANDVTKPQYPSLHFEAYAIKGRDNQIAHPIYLPPLSTSPESVKTVGGNEDVILKIPGLAGFQMKVKANSVTFPDGSRVGTLVVSPVTADKLPMAPPAGGAQFGVPAWTVQPAGTRFDPPIEVTLPNASSQPAGDNLPIVQWDHDLGQYVAMGRATVSEDGSVLITDSGSGITKAGWGGLCRYDPDKCATAKQPSISKLEIKVIGNGDSNAGGKVGEIWVGQNEPLAFISDDAAQNCSRDYTWNFGDGGNSKARNPFYSFSTSGEFNVTLKLKCKGDECVNETERSTNRVVNVCEDAKSTLVTPAFIEVPPARTKGAARNAGHLGITGVEKISVTDISVSCENGDWFPIIKNIRGEFSKYINTSVPNTRSISSPNEADSLWFCEQAMNLSHIAVSAKYTGPEWVYWPAVEAHEAVHMNGMRSRFNTSFVSEYNNYLKINSRLPINEYSKDAAIAKFRQSGYLTDTGAEERFKQFEGNEGFREDGVNQNGSAYVQDKQVSSSLVNGICRRANSSGWNLNNSCTVCNGK